MRVLLLLLLLTACTDFTPPSDDVRIPITDQMRSDWTGVANCYGLHGDIETVKFYVIDRPGNAMVLDGETGVGFYNHSSRSIFMLKAYAEPSLWRHEMLHALLDPIAGHPAKYFVYGCIDDPHQPRTW